jgi:hypothetical protein
MAGRGNSAGTQDYWRNGLDADVRVKDEGQVIEIQLYTFPGMTSARHHRYLNLAVLMIAVGLCRPECCSWSARREGRPRVSVKHLQLSMSKVTMRG